ncbi:MAG: oligosaccharide flippase family protein [Clostridia bacterium]|nr:oligosaccharide flippase family protein [Clostridia bacterium]
MTTKREFLKGGLTLSAVALLMRSVTLAFNAFITKRVGAEGMGLLGLTMSVYAFAVTFATSGIALAVTRLVASALGKNEGARAARTIRAAVLYALLFGGVASAALYLGSDFIARVLLSDLRTRSSLRLLSVSLVPIALSAVYSGYFVAVRRVKHNAVTQILEQTARISLTLLGLSMAGEGNVEMACLALVGGSSIAELFSFFTLFLQAHVDKKRHPLSGGDTGGEGRAVWGYALPCAVSAHARSGLITLEHLLIPICLGWSGMPRELSLASYAAMHSMALPVVLFPTAILSSFSGLLVPECAELEGSGQMKKLSSLASRAVTGALLFSLLSATLLFLGAENFGELLYHNSEVGGYIRALAPLVPIMYMDSVVDAHLKGMGLQVYSMGVNIADAAISVLGVLLLLPLFGAKGYVYVIYVTEIFNFAFSLGKLRRVLTFSLPKRSLDRPLSAAALTLLLFALLLPEAVGTLALVLRLLVGAALFILLYFCFSPAPKRKKQNI